MFRTKRRKESLDNYLTEATYNYLGKIYPKKKRRKVKSELIENISRGWAYADKVFKRLVNANHIPDDEKIRITLNPPLEQNEISDYTNLYEKCRIRDIISIDRRNDITNQLKRQKNPNQSRLDAEKLRKELTEIIIKDEFETTSEPSS